MRTGFETGPSDADSATRCLLWPTWAAATGAHDSRTRRGCELARYLVVAHQTAGSPELREQVLALTREDPVAEFTVLVPATPPSNLLVWEEGDAKEIARQRAEESQKSVTQAGLKVDAARVGDHEPLQAIGDELEAHRGYQAIVISTFPAGVSRWLKMDLVSRARRSFAGHRIIHVVSEPKKTSSV